MKEKSLDELMQELEKIVKDFVNKNTSAEMTESLKRFYEIKAEIKKRCEQ